MLSRPTEAEWLATLTRSYGEAKATALVAALKKAHPEKSIRTLSYMCSGGGLNGLDMRNNVTRMATMKYKQKGAPAFAWYFTWQSPMLEDAGAWHTAELAFCFDNTSALRAGDRQRAGSSGAGEEDGNGLGELRPDRQSQPARLAVGAVRARAGPDDGVRQRLPDGRRSGSGGAEDSVELAESAVHFNFDGAVALAPARPACEAEAVAFVDALSTDILLHNLQAYQARPICSCPRDDLGHQRVCRTRSAHHWMDPHRHEVHDCRRGCIARAGHHAAGCVPIVEGERGAGRQPPAPVLDRATDLPFIRGSERVWRVGQRLQSELAKDGFVTTSRPPHLHRAIVTRRQTWRAVTQPNVRTKGKGRPLNPGPPFTSWLRGLATDAIKRCGLDSVGRRRSALSAPHLKGLAESRERAGSFVFAVASTVTEFRLAALDDFRNWLIRDAA